MLKILLLVTLSVLLMAEDSEETCYTVQLVSERDTVENREHLENKQYADGCKIMKIGSNQTVRCGCYDKMSDAKDKLTSLYDEYVNAYITNTYKYRFKDNKPQNEQKTRSQSEETTTQCYSVEILNKEKTQENLDAITKKSFPKNCVNIELENQFSVRCGCFNNKDSVLTEYLKLKQKYPNTIIKISEKKQFETDLSLKQEASSQNTTNSTDHINKIAELEAMIEELQNTIQQQELFIENMGNVKEEIPKEEISKEEIPKEEKTVKIPQEKESIEKNIEEDEIVINDEEREVVEQNKEEDAIMIADKESIIENDDINIEDEEIVIEEDEEIMIEDEEQDVKVEKPITNNSKNSYFIGTTIGLALNQEMDESGFNSGIELGYIYNKNLFATLNYQYTKLLDANFHNFLSSVNYKLDEIFFVSPYAGLVLGFGNQTSDSSFLLGAQLGFEKSLSEDIDLYTFYRYMSVDYELKRDVSHKGEHNINIGLKYNF